MVFSSMARGSKITAALALSLFSTLSFAATSTVVKGAYIVEFDVAANASVSQRSHHLFIPV